MQTASFSIWTRVSEVITYDDNHYTTSTSNIWNVLENIMCME